MQNRKILRLLLSFIVVLALLLSLTGCKDKNKPTIETTKATKTTEPITKEKTTEESTDETTSGTDKTSGKFGGGSGGSGGSGGGGGGGQAQGTTKAPATTAAKSNSYYAPQVYYNSASGAAVQALADGTQIDYSNAASGYVMLKYSGAHSNVRLQVAAPDGVTPVYPIFSTGWEAIPLTNGNGNYTFRVLANDGGNSYTVVGSVDIPVTLSYSTAAFYRPNIYCNYDGGTSCVNYAAELTRGCDTEVAKIQAIYNYVVGNFHYDYGKASSVASAAYVPNLNSVWASKSGICFDYASTMAAMLRTQGLPTRVCIGYVNGSTYHAWISVYVQGTGWVNNIIQFNGNSWKLMDPTFASTGGNKYDWSQRGSYSAMYYY
ncbi:MAG: transglutaminase-like domain-containing protein [Clostridia bacterium]|nr:transglutaminase-like domain-containing protein [Clostridia bacterium]